MRDHDHLSILVIDKIQWVDSIIDGLVSGSTLSDKHEFQSQGINKSRTLCYVCILPKSGANVKQNLHIKNWYLTFLNTWFRYGIYVIHNDIEYFICIPLSFLKIKIDDRFSCIVANEVLPVVFNLSKLCLYR